MTGCDPAAGSSCCGCDGAADQCRTMEDQKSLDLRQLSTQKTDDARLGAEWSTQQPCVPQLDGSFVRWVLQMQWRPPSRLRISIARTSAAPSFPRSVVKRNAPAGGRNRICRRRARVEYPSTRIHGTPRAVFIRTCVDGALAGPSRDCTPWLKELKRNEERRDRLG